MSSTVWRGSLFLRTLAGLGDHVRASGCYRWMTGFGTLRPFEEDAPLYQALARGLAALRPPLRRRLQNAGLGGVTDRPEPAGLSGTSRVYRFFRYFAVEDLLYLLLPFAFWDFFLRSTPPAALLWKVWDKGLFVLVVAAWVARQVARGERVYRRTPLDLPVIVFAAVMIGLFFFNSPVTGIGFAGLRVYVEYILWFFVGSNLVRSRGRVHNIVWVLLAVAFLVSLYGNYQYYIKVPIPPQWVDQAEPSLTTRVFSVVESPNVLGSFLVLTIPLALAELLAAGRTWKRPAAMVMLLSMIACLVFTYTRAAWFALLAGLVLFALLYNWRLLAGLVAAALAVPAAMPSVTARLLYLLSPAYLASSARAGRLERWGAALSQVRLHPLMGDGLGWYGGAVAANEVPGSFYVDSFYVKTAAETGLIGSLALLWLLVSVVRCGLATTLRLSEPYLKLVSAALIAGLFGVLVHNAVENIFEVPMMSTYFWFLAGVMAGLPGVERESGGRDAG